MSSDWLPCHAPTLPDCIGVFRPDLCPPTSTPFRGCRDLRRGGCRNEHRGSSQAGLTLPIPPAVVLQAGVRPLRVATGGCGRGLGPMDPVGRLQPDVRWRRVLLQPSLRQPQVSLQDPLPGELAGRGRAPYSCPISLLSSALSRPTIGGKYCLGERRRHRSCNTDVSFPGASSPVLREKGINQFTRSNGLSLPCSAPRAPRAHPRDRAPSNSCSR